MVRSVFLNNSYIFLFTSHISLRSTPNESSFLQTQPTVIFPCHIPHNAFMRSALPSAVIRAGVVFNPDSFSCLIFDPVKYSHLPAYLSCFLHSQIAQTALTIPQWYTFPAYLIKTAHKPTRSLTAG